MVVLGACGDDSSPTLAAGGARGDRPSPGPVEPVPAPPPQPDGTVGEITVEIEPASVRSSEAEREAENLRVAVLRESVRWATAAAATEAGFVPMPLDPSHWYHPTYVDDDRFFDPAAPEFLVVDGDDVLGVMFLASSPGLDQPDPPGAPLVRWHYHRWSDVVCLAGGMVIVSEASDGTCEAGQVATDISPLMAHVWLIDLDDPFATNMDAHQH